MGRPKGMTRVRGATVPECGSPVSEVIQGRELLVAALEMEEVEMEIS